MEELIRKIVREELTAALSSLSASVEVMGEQVELDVRATVQQGDGEVLGGTGRQPATRTGRRPAPAGDADGIAPRRVPSPIDDAFLEEVAGLYRQAVADGGSPNKTIQETFGRSRSAVSQWLRQAREKGFLPETQPGRVSTFDEGAAGAERE